MMTNSVEENKYRLLIVDDNPSIHDDIRKILDAEFNQDDSLSGLEAELFGETEAKATEVMFEIDSAYQGEEAHKCIINALGGSRPYSLAFVDMRMPPGWDGIDTITHIWEEDPNVQIIICTAYSDRSWAEIVQKLGRSDRLLILKKPFDSIEIVQAVHALTQKWVLHRQVLSKLNDLESIVQKRTEELKSANEQLKKEITDRERTEAELRLAQKLEAVGQLAAGIAHEINTPIQYVGDNIHFLKSSFDDMRNLVREYQKLSAALNINYEEKPLLDALNQTESSIDLAFIDEETPAAFNSIIDGVRRVVTIVQAMKEFAHPGDKEKISGDLNKALLNTLTIANNELKYVAEIETDLGDIPLVSCHLGDINQVFLNLIVNAAHAIAEVVGNSKIKGKIFIKTFLDGNFVEIRISDTGCGIPQEIHSRVFDPFFTTKTVGKGSGQGLAIAYAIVVEKHGGSLTFESEVDKGTTFYIRLPVNASKAKQILK